MFVVILLTGASHTGKTLLAQRLLEQYYFPYLSAATLLNSGKPALSAKP